MQFILRFYSPQSQQSARNFFLQLADKLISYEKLHKFNRRTGTAGWYIQYCPCVSQSVLFRTFMFTHYSVHRAANHRTSKLVSNCRSSKGVKKFLITRMNWDTYWQINNCKSFTSLKNFAVFSGDIKAEAFNNIFPAPANRILKQKMWNSMSNYVANGWILRDIQVLRNDRNKLWIR
jgi:hypothetical protein